MPISGQDIRDALALGLRGMIEKNMTEFKAKSIEDVKVDETTPEKKKVKTLHQGGGAESDE